MNESTQVATLVGTAESNVAVSSPNQDGRYLVVWNDSDDIWMRGTETAPTWLTPSRNLQALENGSAGGFLVNRQPSVDTDGLRFAVAYAEGPPGPVNDDVLVSTVSLTATNLRVDEARIAVASVPDFSDDTPRVASPFSSRRATWTTIEDYGIAYAFSSTIFASTHGVEVRRYDGYASVGGFSTFGSACGTPLTLSATGVPALGRTVSFDLAPVFPLAGFLFGTPDAISLIPICPCTLGVDGTIVAGTTLSLTIPSNVSFVGLTLSCQGFSFASGPCFGSVSLSDTIDMRMR